MNISWRYLIIFLGLFLLVGLAFAYPSLVVTYLVEPITRILWLILRSLQVIDQKVYWALLIIAAFTLILRIIPDRPEIHTRQAFLDGSPQDDRVASWETLLHSAADDPDARLALQHALRNLQTSIDDLRPGGPRNEIVLPRVQIDLRRRISSRWQRTFFARIVPAPGQTLDRQLENQVDLALQSMEIQLEVDHEHDTSHPDHG